MGTRKRTLDVPNVFADDGSFQVYNSDADDTLFTTKAYAEKLARVNHFGSNVQKAISSLKNGEYIKLRFENGTDTFSNGAPFDCIKTFRMAPRSI